MSSVEPVYAYSVRQFSLIGIKALDALKPHAMALKSHFVSKNSLLENEKQIKKIMRCIFTPEDQEFLCKTDEVVNQQKTEEQQNDMIKRRQILRRVNDLWKTLISLMFPDEETMKTPKKTRSSVSKPSPISVESEETEIESNLSFSSDSTEPEIKNKYEEVSDEFIVTLQNPNKHLHEMSVPFQMIIVAPVSTFLFIDSLID